MCLIGLMEGSFVYKRCKKQVCVPIVTITFFGTASLTIFSREVKFVFVLFLNQ